MLEIHPIPAFNDNYIWIIFDNNSKNALVVDPGDAKPVNTFLQKHNLKLSYILITHHHFDHTGGVSQLKAEHKPITYGPNNLKIQDIDHRVSEGVGESKGVSEIKGKGVSESVGESEGAKDNINLKLDLLDLELNVLDIPGHTLDHVAYFGINKTTNTPILFCGDTMFSAGCGRLFEGTAVQMHHSLSKLVKLPDNTKVYCAHEYTLSNLKFAKSILPQDIHIQDHVEKVKVSMEKNIPSLPSSIKQEKLSNLFLRCHEDVLQKALGIESNDNNKEIAAFTKLRKLKDEF